MIFLEVSATPAARPSYTSSISSKALEWREMFEHTFIRAVYKNFNSLITESTLCLHYKDSPVNVV
jgi:hypothetical protein